MNLEGIRVLIRARMHDGRLPRDHPPQSLGRPGNGQNCGACDEILTTAKLMMELTNSGTTFFVHGDCYLLWLEERIAPTS
jgi:hypothetical protein